MLVFYLTSFQFDSAQGRKPTIKKRNDTQVVITGVLLKLRIIYVSQGAVTYATAAYISMARVHSTDTFVIIQMHHEKYSGNKKSPSNT